MEDVVLFTGNIYIFAWPARACNFSSRFTLPPFAPFNILSFILWLLYPLTFFFLNLQVHQSALANAILPTLISSFSSIYLLIIML